MTPRSGDNVKLCYCDESGTGDQPIAVMVGILVDCQRMHITKRAWHDFLEDMSDALQTDSSISELHTRNFYAGNGIWREMDGQKRTQVIDDIFQWLADRKHRVAYSAVDQKLYRENFAAQRIPDELNTVWRFLGFHLILAIQKFCKREKGTKGHTIFIFDNEKREEVRFADIIKQPQVWSEEYYKRAKEMALDQIVDVPYFGDSKDIALIQVADVCAFFLRRYAEIQGNLVPAKFAGEKEKVTKWVRSFVSRSIGGLYIQRGRSWSESLFFDNAPPSIRELS